MGQQNRTSSHSESSLGILLFSKIFYLKEGKSKHWWTYNLEMTTVSIFQVFEKQQQVEAFSVLQSHPSPLSLVAEQPLPQIWFGVSPSRLFLKFIFIHTY